MDEVFKALGDPTRLRIVEMLAQHGEVCVCKIVEDLDMHQPAVSHHMAKLKQAGLLNARKDGQWIHYSLKFDVLRSGPLEFVSKLVSLAERSCEKVVEAGCCECDRSEE